MRLTIKLKTYLNQRAPTTKMDNKDNVIVPVFESKGPYKSDGQ